MMILQSQEPSPVTVVNPRGESRFVLVCEHAGNMIPARLDNMGLAPSELARHIAWDIGAAALARDMADILGATLFLQTYSRLICDCNHRVSAHDFAPATSEHTHVPGNAGLSSEEKSRRAAEIFHPFHDTIAAEIDRRVSCRNDLVVVSVHSFTPVFKGVSRPWHVGVLYNRDRVFAPRSLEILRQTATLEVGDNQPYSMDDDSDYTLPVHGEARGVPCAKFEVRNDLIGTADGRAEWAQRLCRTIESAAEALPGGP